MKDISRSHICLVRQCMGEARRKGGYCEEMLTERKKRKHIMNLLRGMTESEMCTLSSICPSFKNNWVAKQNVHAYKELI